MDFQIIVDSFPQLLGGLGITIQITVIGLLIGGVMAVPLALLRLSKNPVLWMPVYGYIFFFRGTPLLVQIFLIYYGSGQFRPLPPGFNPFGTLVQAIDVVESAPPEVALVEERSVEDSIV